ncbi:hypothetical protein LIER_09015 [Lithospermum erythrorhizon]|uniref:Pectinesterase inhibitor domain-containing protein n=1 Tax=Lithospermum erythrorhizon TaxID=34254 RepID=A0AAV3PI28_LITER
MKPNFSSFPLYIFFILFVSSFIYVPIEASNLIEETCKRCAQNDPNVKYGFCKTSLQAAPASQCANLKGLGSISIKLLRYNVTDTRCHIKHLLKNKKWDKYYLQRLNDCFELYSDAITTVKQAMNSYHDKRYDDANIQISAIMDDSNTCEDGFKEGGNSTSSPLSKRNENLFELGATSLCILMNMEG